LLPVNSAGHTGYQNFIVSQLCQHFPDPDTIPKDSWDIIERLWLTDLSSVDKLMESQYSVYGPQPRLPSDMLRSYLASILFGIPSITKWVSQMRICPLYAIVSGFPFWKTPGIGTFYDFFSRLWQSGDANFSSHIHSPKPKVKKPSKKGAKAESSEKVTVESLLAEFRLTPVSTEQPFSLLLDIYCENFLKTSAAKGLIDTEKLSLAGDGTPVVTSARIRKKRTCSCREQGISDCNCDRYFSQPDCDIGWDSSRDCFYHGFDLYMLTASDSESDLPVFPLLSPASRHDSQGFLHCFFSMKAFLPDFNIQKLLLDSAHDAMPIYEYCAHNNITPFIDLNAKRGAKVKYKDDFTVGADGVPVCRAGRKMNHDGAEKRKHRVKFRCPLTSRKYGCSCKSPCSDSKYGRTVHLASKDNPRLFNIPPRDSKQWKTQYNARTSAERCNKRMKIDFLLESGHHRSSKMWYCRLYGIMMCQHLDAWDLPFESELKKRIRSAA